MVDTSEDGKIAAKNSFLHTLAIAFLAVLVSSISNQLLAISTMIFLATNLLLYYILRVGLDLKKVQKQNKKLLIRNP